MKKLLTIIVMFVALGFHGSFSLASGTIQIEVTGLKNDTGEVLVSIYDNEDFFPQDADKAIQKQRAPILNGTATLTFKGLHYGRYAAAVMHDENKNEKLDVNGTGIPVEGFGFSNNAKGSFGPPSFGKAAFDLKSAKKTMKIKTKYFFK